MKRRRRTMDSMKEIVVDPSAWSGLDPPYQLPVPSRCGVRRSKDPAARAATVPTPHLSHYATC